MSLLLKEVAWCLMSVLVLIFLAVDHSLFWQCLCVHVCKDTDNAKAVKYLKNKTGECELYVITKLVNIY